MRFEPGAVRSPITAACLLNPFDDGPAVAPRQPLSLSERRSSSSTDDHPARFEHLSSARQALLKEQTTHPGRSASFDGAHRGAPTANANETVKHYCAGHGNAQTKGKQGHSRTDALASEVVAVDWVLSRVVVVVLCRGTGEVVDRRFLSAGLEL
jgi:hypothetical protein